MTEQTLDGRAASLARLDNIGRDLAGRCAAFNSDCDSVTLLRGRTGADARIRDTEAAIALTQAEELALQDWHGPTSFQRLIWQDRGFLELIAEPDVLAQVLLRFRQGRERNLGSATIGQAFVNGLVVNRPSYLFSVCPNWAAVPDLSEFYFSVLDDMRPPGRRLQKHPFRVTPELLEAAELALASANEVLARLPVIHSRTRREDWERSTKMNCLQLRLALAQLLTPERCDVLVHDPAVRSTAIPRMRRQTEEVLEIVEAGNAETAMRPEDFLGYALFSHGLDAKHLLAGLLDTEPACVAAPERREFACSSRVNRVLDFPADQSFARFLVEIRWRQALHLVLCSHGKLGLVRKEIDHALDRAARAISN